VIPSADIAIVGLGPGHADLLTLEAREALRSARVFLRTRHHPVVNELPEAVAWESFDDLYERHVTFEAIYQAILGRLLEEAARAPLVYAVPGHPLVGETTTRLLLEEAPQRGLSVSIVPGLSFVDATLPLLGIDAMGANLQVVDALELVACLERQPFSAGSWPLSPHRPALIGQVYDRLVAGDVKLALFRLYPEDWPVTLLRAAGSPKATKVEVPLCELDHHEVDDVTAIYAPAVPAERARTVDALQQIVARLRAPGGCPWDREQTHRSLVRHLVEEAYEVVDAIESGDSEALRDELGDYLLQALMHAQIAEEAGEFTFEDVVDREIRKLVRRHPHVFGGVQVETSAAVLENWEQIKRRERADLGKADEDSVARLPRAMPALSRAQAVIRYGHRHGLEVLPEERVTRLHAVLPAAQLTAEALAEILVACCVLAQEVRIDAEQALRRWTLVTEERLSLSGRAGSGPSSSHTPGGAAVREGVQR
jgi:tetrapyrrole methylase family protein/MazG family protein